jgi:hypothetical protein
MYVKTFHRKVLPPFQCDRSWLRIQLMIDAVFGLNSVALPYTIFCFSSHQVSVSKIRVQFATSEFNLCLFPSLYTTHHHKFTCKFNNILQGLNIHLVDPN